jgi:hypothetical protein
VDLAEFEESVATVKQTLSPDVFDAASARGAALSLDEIVALVMSLP